MVSTAVDRAFDLAAPAPNPLDPSQRIEAIDVLRGLALFGVIAIHAAEAGFSASWLRRYRYGPVEWLWRSAMYGNWQRMVTRGA
jgi:uncharacterized membrane protein YeiB